MYLEAPSKRAAREGRRASLAILIDRARRARGYPWEAGHPHEKGIDTCEMLEYAIVFLGVPDFTWCYADPLVREITEYAHRLLDLLFDFAPTRNIAPRIEPVIADSCTAARIHVTFYEQCPHEARYFIWLNPGKLPRLEALAPWVRR